MLLKNRNNRTAQQWADTFFLLMLALYLLRLENDIMMNGYSLPLWADRMIRCGAFFAAGARCALNLGSIYNRKTLPLLAVAAGILLLSWNHVEYDFLLMLAIFLFGACGLEEKKYFRVYLVTIGTALILSVLSASTGAFTDLVYSATRSDGTHFLRSAFGLCYPTDCAAAFLFFLLAFWGGERKISGLVTAALAALGAWASWSLCNAQNSMVLFLLLCVCSLLLTVYDRWLCHIKWLEKTVSVFARVSCALFTLLAGLTYAATVYYGSLSDAAKAASLNSLSHDRLRLGFEALTNYGVTLLGTAFELVGGGSGTASRANYNFVDCGYLLILVRYGLLALLLFCALYALGVLRAAKKKNYRLVVCFALLALHSVLEHHAPELNFNCFLLVPALNLTDSEAPKRSLKEWLSYKSHQVAIAVAAIVGGLLALSPIWLTQLRTIVTIHEWTEQKNLALRATFLILLWMVVACLVFGGIISLISSEKNQKKRRQLSSCALALGLLGAGIGGWYGNHTLKKGMQIYESAMETEEETFSALSNLIAEDGEKEHSVLVADVPMLYRKQYSFVRNTVWNKENLARYQKATIIVNRDDNLSVLIDRGYLFAEISDKHAVYTNDFEVISALREQGVHFYNYYSAEKKVALTDWAGKNGLDRTDSGGLFLWKNGNSLIYGPYLALPAGNYEVIFSVSLANPNEMNSLKSEQSLCTLRVSAYYGQNILAEEEITAAMLNNGGHAEVTLPFTSRNYEGMEFLVFSQGSADLTVDSIAYRQLGGENNVYSFYNEKGQVIRQEYYDADGNPIVTSSGYFAVEKEYDDKGNLATIRYYDINNRLCLNTDGFAEVRYEYDSRKRIVRSEYYGVKEELIICNGRAVEEWEYDEKGRVVEYRYFDEQGNPSLAGQTYAVMRRLYNGADKKTEESYYDANGEPICSNAGYASIQYSYLEDIYLSRVETFDEEGELISSQKKTDYQFLQFLKQYKEEPNVEILLSVRDEASNALSAEAKQWLKENGFPVLSKLGYGESYIALEENGETVLEQSSAEETPLQIALDSITIISAGMNSGSLSSIVVDGVEYSLNSRGVNAAVVNRQTNQVLETRSFDTYQYQVMIP